MSDEAIVGEHDQHFQAEVVRLTQQGVHRDQSTFFMMTSIGHVPLPVVAGLIGLRRPRVDRFEWHLTVAPSTSDGYNTLVFDMLRSGFPFKYVFSVEDDVIIPPNALMRLIQGMEAGYDVVGGLCWEKRDDGIPMLLGDPSDPTTSFQPRVPEADALMPVNGVHLGCTLIRAAIFRDKRWGTPECPLPWFYEGKPLGHPDAEADSTLVTADLAFCHRVTQLGYTIAVDTGVRCGHFDRKTGRIF